MRRAAHLNRGRAAGERPLNPCVPRRCAEAGATNGIELDLGCDRGRHMCRHTLSSRGQVAADVERLHNVSMPNVLVRDLPEEVHARLQARAAERGQSLQQYLASEMRRLAERPTMDEVLARIGSRRGGTVGLDQAVADLAAERYRR